MHHMLNEIIPLISQYGLWVIFFGMILEGTIMIIVTGILCYLGMISFSSALLVSIIGAIVGDQIWYFIGRKYSIYFLKKFPRLKHRIFKLKSSIFNKGYLLAFSSRFIYSAAIIFPIALGSYKYNYKKFTFFDALGVIIWSLIGILFGYIFGNSAEYMFGEITKIWHFILLIIISISIVYILKYYYTHKKNLN